MRDPGNRKMQALNFDDVIDDILASTETPLRRGI
jgi:hypothetical protein